MSKNTKGKIKFKKPKLKPVKLFKPSFLWAHILVAVSLLPVIAAFWFAVPKFTINNGSETITVDNILNELQLSVERYGFYEGIDLQSGATLEYSLEKSDAALSGSGSSTTGSGNVSIEESGSGSTSLSYNQKKEQTIETIHTRLQNLNLSDWELFIADKGEGQTNLIVNLNGSREGIGFNLPVYLRSTGIIEIWVDDPNYKPPEDGEDFNFFNPVQGKVKTTIEDNEILFAEVINDIKTGGWGIKLHFTDSAATKLAIASQDIGSGSQPYGFMLLVDGVPAAYQSAQYDVTNDPRSVYFTTSGKDEVGMRTLTTLVNSQNLLLDVTSVSNNNILSSRTQIDIEAAKLVLLVVYIIINIAILVKFKMDGLLGVIVNLSVLTLGVLLLKLTRQVLNIELLLGVFIGISIILYLQILKLSKLVKAKERKDKEQVKTIAENFRSIYSKIFFIPGILLLISLTSGLGYEIVGELILPLVTFLAIGFGVEWLIARTLTNVLFTIPIDYEKENRK